jgi:GntR family transcriptional regulator, transcriptional repressor for pyruvate dehydrogenase complex
MSTTPGNRLQRGKKIGEVVAREIIRDAMRRELQPGSRLQSETEMLERYEVARGSLREALRILEVHGLIEVRAGRNGGAVLASASDRSFGKMSTLFFMARGVTYREVLEARVSLTELMARLAAERATPDGVEDLFAAVAEGELQTTGDDSDWLAYTTRFYSTLGEICGNRVVATSGLAFMSIWVEHLPSLPYPTDYRTKIAAAHREIAEAIGAADAQRAENLMRAHMESFKARFKRQYMMFLDEIVDWE